MITCNGNKNDNEKRIIELTDLDHGDSKEKQL